MKLLFEFYVNSSIHVALAVSSLILITYWEINKTPNLALLGYLFFMTISGYNFVKYAKVAGLHHRSLTNSLKAIQILSAISTAIALYFAIKLPLDVLLTSLIFGILTFFYAVPFLSKKSLRTFSGTKILIVAMVWAGVTVIVPFLEMNEPFTTDHGLVFTQRFVLIIVLTLPFEIRDIRYDLPHLRTLPQVFGVGRSKWIGILLLAFAVGLELFKDDVNNLHFLSLNASCILIAIALRISSQNQSKYFASFWVEAIPIFWAGLFLFLKYYYLEIS
ncbi:MAG: hypothetical protein HKN48_12280 [Flavobacteriaceae bacterium]|nr:hypothetical protein [Flavobacteriaceae bacterium]